jgi:excisionase family DNA binding protein
VTDANTRASTAQRSLQERVQLLVDRLEAARALCVSPGTIDNLRRSGDLPSVKIGTRRLFDMADLRRFIEARKAVKP